MAHCCMAPRELGSNAAPLHFVSCTFVGAQGHGTGMFLVHSYVCHAKSKLLLLPPTTQGAHLRLLDMRLRTGRAAQALPQVPCSH